MSTSTKTPASIRQGGPGASHENAKEPLHVEKPPADDPNVGTAKYPEVAANAIAITLITRKERAAAQIQLRRMNHE